ncbi:hypothetical protein BDK92_7070 [Micromonospora pisi]|uniref:HTH cro/C1-type domain-containing protein n=1 Tax=Micromonospora pisi TaxID=589240 RepID=A0A495JVM0_9ACTN|nr:XRE family transcriptional regulator [Micromonospora pisi]RKR92628.1 hypothetical protein BDK92_7070 [Micromonospora pisi]
MTAEDPKESRIARRLDTLFRSVPDTEPGPDGKPRAYTHRRVSEELRRRGVACSPQYIHMLRTGRRDNPAPEVVEGLAKVFDVEPKFFLADDEEVKGFEDQLALLVSLRDSGVRQVALRAFGLPADSLAFVLEVIKRERRLGGLPPDSP